jgi:hypothetical protein
MAVGAFVGDWMLRHAHTYAPVLPVLVIALVIAIASVALKQQPRDSPCRPRVGRRRGTRRENHQRGWGGSPAGSTLH